MTRMTRLYKILKVVSAALFALAFAACEPDFDFNTEFEHGNMPGNGGPVGDRRPNEEIRNVLVLYSAGYNSISSYLKEDIEDLKKGWLPKNGRCENVMLVYSHQPVSGGNYSAGNPPVLMRLWEGQDGKAAVDTLVIYDEAVRSASAAQLNEVLTYVRDEFPAKSYGMVFSSHATGYLPAGYYTNPYKYVYGDNVLLGLSSAYRDRFVPYVAPVYDPGHPAVKSIGQDHVIESGASRSYEIELQDFADAIPMYFDYILFDACLMGGVEVAYELKEKCGYVGFSQTEVLAEGFDYTMLATHLLKNGSPDPLQVCMDYFNQYDIQTGIYRSATISMVDCSAMDALASACKELFEKYRGSVSALDPDDVQRYFRADYHWFYDLQDILSKAGVSEGEMAVLEDALDKCIVYKASTPDFMGSFRIRTYSGLSMYLPCDGSSELDKYYRTLQWNIDTGLVE